MRREVDRTQVAHRDFVIVGIQGYLGAQIGAMHHADVLLRRADIAGILESDPWMAGFKQHADSILRHRCSAGIFLYS